MTNHAFDRRIEALARTQQYAFNRPQVLDLDGTDAMINARLTNNVWRSPDLGLYVLNSSKPSWLQDARLATLGHPEAQISGPAAAAMHQLRYFERRVGDLMEIQVPLAANHRSQLARVRRSSNLVHTFRYGIPVQVPAHTVFRVVRKLGWDRSVKLVEDAFREGILTPEELCLRYVDIAGSRLPGMALIRGIIEVYGVEGIAIAASILEEDFDIVGEDPRVPSMAREVPAVWGSNSKERNDRLIRLTKILCEIDGRRWHSRLQDLNNDRRRDQLAVAAGYVVLRFGHEQIRHDPESVITIIERTHRERLLLMGLVSAA